MADVATYDFFISAKYRNKENALGLLNEIRKLGYRAYFCAESEASLTHFGSLESDAEQAMQQLEARKADDPAVTNVFKTDLDIEKKSEKVILLLPAGISCHIEVGIAYGLGKRLILIGVPETTETLYQIFHERYPDQATFLESLPSKLPMKEA